MEEGLNYDEYYSKAFYYTIGTTLVLPRATKEIHCSIRRRLHHLFGKDVLLYERWI